MDYTLAGFTFHFDLNDQGRVISITTPDISVGPVMVLPSTVLNFDPALTVEGAQAVVYGILSVLGLA